MLKEPTAEEKGTDNNRLDLIRQAEGRRVTVRRIRELFEGERDPSQIKHTDWLTTLEYIREDTDTEAVLYFETETAATITALDDTGLWCIVAGYSPQAGFTRSKIPRWDVEDSFRFAQPKDPIHDIMALEDAKARVKAFAAEE